MSWLDRGCPPLTIDDGLLPKSNSRFGGIVSPGRAEPSEAKRRPAWPTPCNLRRLRVQEPGEVVRHALIRPFLHTAPDSCSTLPLFVFPSLPFPSFLRCQLSLLHRQPTSVCGGVGISVIAASYSGCDQQIYSPGTIQHHIPWASTNAAYEEGEDTGRTRRRNGGLNSIHPLHPPRLRRHPHPLPHRLVVTRRGGPGEVSSVGDIRTAEQADGGMEEHESERELERLVAIVVWKRRAQRRFSSKALRTRHNPRRTP